MTLLKLIVTYKIFFVYVLKGVGNKPIINLKPNNIFIVLENIPSPLHAEAILRIIKILFGEKWAPK